MEQTGGWLRMRLRSFCRDDLPFLWMMLYEAVHWDLQGFRPPLAELADDPDASMYLQDWGRRGDTALVAEESEGPIGAAWYRYFTLEQPSFGYIDDDTPELVVGVRQEARGRGVGEALVRSLIRVAERSNVESLSLNVIDGNPAQRLYRRIGFEPVSHICFEREGVIGRAVVMRLALEEPNS